MKIEIDLEELEKLEITPNQYVYALLISKGLKPNFMGIMQSQNDEKLVIKDLFKLWQKDYISKEIEDVYTFDFDNIKVNIFNNKKEKNYDGSFDSFCEKFYEMFPKGVKSGGYPVRSGIEGVKSKLKKFVKQYKHYDYETIIKATKNYINECERNGFQYMKTAQYFIFKDDTSTLESYCEKVKNGEDVLDNQSYRQEV